MPKSKNTKNKRSLLSKLANLSKRARLLIVIFSFILIGGIYFTYRSFAASATYIFSVRNNNLLSYTTEWPGAPKGCVKNIINDQNKGNMAVYNFYCPGINTSQYKALYGFGLSAIKINIASGRYRLCATVQGATPALTLYLRAYNESSDIIQSWGNISTSGYQTFCTRWTNSSTITKINQLKMETDNGAQNNRAQWINVSMLTLERQ